MSVFPFDCKLRLTVVLPLFFLFLESQISCCTLTLLQSQQYKGKQLRRLFTTDRDAHRPHNHSLHLTTLNILRAPLPPTILAFLFTFLPERSGQFALIQSCRGRHVRPPSRIATQRRRGGDMSHIWVDLGSKSHRHYDFLMVGKSTKLVQGPRAVLMQFATHDPRRRVGRPLGRNFLRSLAVHTRFRLAVCAHTHQCIYGFGTIRTSGRQRSEFCRVMMPV